MKIEERIRKGRCRDGSSIGINGRIDDCGNRASEYRKQAVLREGAR